MNTILLQDGTVGTTDYDCEIGDTITVSLHDENGNNIEVTGIVEEIIN